MNEVINVLYGTLSGNSESCAELLRDSLSAAGLQQNFQAFLK